MCLSAGPPSSQCPTVSAQEPEAARPFSGPAGIRSLDEFAMGWQACLLCVWGAARLSWWRRASHDLICGVGRCSMAFMLYFARREGDHCEGERKGNGNMLGGGIAKDWQNSLEALGRGHARLAASRSCQRKLSPPHTLQKGKAVSGDAQGSLPFSCYAGCVGEISSGCTLPWARQITHELLGASSGFARRGVWRREGRRKKRVSGFQGPE